MVKHFREKVALWLPNLQISTAGTTNGANPFKVFPISGNPGY